MPIDNVSGKATLTGHSDGEGIVCGGKLDIRSLTYRDIQITNVHGPILIDDRQILLGARVGPVGGAAAPFPGGLGFRRDALRGRRRRVGEGYRL